MAAVNKNKLLDNATKYIQKGQVDRAIKELQKVIEADPSDVRTRLKLGDLFAKKNQNAEASEQYKIVAESYSKDGFYLKAVAVYKQILKLDSAMIDVNLKLGDLYHQLGLLSDAMTQYQIVAQHYDSKGMAAESLATLRKMVELDPENLQSRKKLAEIIAREGNTAEAIEEFKKIAEDLKAKARLDDLAGVLERIVHLDGSNLDMVRELAALYLDRGDPKRALAKLQICFRSNPHDLGTLEMLSRAFVSLGQPEKAKSVYREIAKIHEGAGNEAGKMEAYRAILSLDPGDPEARAVVEGRAPEPSVGGWEQPAPAPMEDPAPMAAPAASPSMAARAPVSAEQTEDPQAISKALTEADVYLKYGLLEKALDHLRGIVRRNPGNVDAHLKLKDVYLQHKDIESAVAEILSVIELCEQSGDTARASEALQEGLRFAPGHPQLSAKESALGGSAPIAIGDDAAPEAWNGAQDGGDGVEISIDGGDAPEVLIDDPGMGGGMDVSIDADAEIQIPDDAGVEIQVDDPSAQDDGSLDVDADVEIEPIPQPVDESVDVSLIDDVSIDPGDLDEAALGDIPSAPAVTGAARGGGAVPRGAEVVSLDARRSEIHRNAPAAGSSASEGSGRIQMPEPSAISPDQLLDELATAFDAGDSPMGEATDDDAISIEDADGLSIDMGDGEPGISADAEVSFDGAPETMPDPAEEAPARARGNLRSIEERFGATDEHDIAKLSEQAEEISVDAAPDPEPVSEPMAGGESGVTDFSVDLGPDELSVDEALPDESALALETDDAVAVDELSKLNAIPPAPAPSASSSAASVIAAATGPADEGEIPPEVAEDVDEADFFVKQEIYDEAVAVYKRLLKKFPGNPALLARMERAQALLNGEPLPARAAPAPAAAPVAKAPAPAPARPAEPPPAAPPVTAPATAAPAPAPAAKAPPAVAPVAPAHEETGATFDLAAELMAELDEIAEEEDGPSFDESEQVSVADVLREFRKGVDKQVGTEDKQARYDLGIAYREMGLLDEAIGEFEIASSDAARRTDCLNMMGLCQRDKGDLDAAIKSFSEAIKAPNIGNKQKAAFFYELAATLEAQGQNGKALQAYKQVQALDPGFRDVEKKIKQLGDGGSAGMPNKKIGFL